MWPLSMTGWAVELFFVRAVAPVMSVHDKSERATTSTCEKTMAQMSVETRSRWLEYLALKTGVNHVRYRVPRLETCTLQVCSRSMGRGDASPWRYAAAAAVAAAAKNGGVEPVYRISHL